MVLCDGKSMAASSQGWWSCLALLTQHVQPQFNFWYKFKPWTGGILRRKVKLVFHSFLLYDTNPQPWTAPSQPLGPRVSPWRVGGRLW